MWRLLDQADECLSLEVDGHEYSVPRGISVAAALLYLDLLPTRASDVSAAPRAPYCMMGVCFECRVQIDGVDAQRGCLVTVRENMCIKRHLPDAGDES